ncbi:o-succinylbenzoate synthase [Staphylococcus simulans]|uniref:o-succinylbenzoate synthase n=1 Tax=Staphylococcus simulans TaxID=1286 RepID=UPI00399C1C31
MRFESIQFYTYDAPFKHQIKTPKVTLDTRKVLVIGLVNHQGQTYFGECNAFETNWYDTETIESVYLDLKHWFDETLKGIDIDTFETAITLLNQLNQVPAARSTAAMALYQAFHTLPSFEVQYGATISGLTTENFQQLETTQPKRVKLKWSEHVVNDLRKLHTLPFKPSIALDANESLTADDLNTLEKVQNSANILYIEEPFKDLEVLNSVSSAMIPPVALDEKARDVISIVNIAKQYPIDTVVLKPFRLGGIDKVLEAIECLHQHHMHVVIGGMYEYGLSRYFTAYLSQYADYPGDVTPYGYYFEREFTQENGILKRGHLYFVPPEIDVTQLKTYS